MENEYVRKDYNNNHIKHRTNNSLIADSPPDVNCAIIPPIKAPTANFWLTVRFR